MPLDRFMIAPLTTGLETDVKPWLIPDNAFEELNNAYVFRGRVRKRFGSYPMNTPATINSRLRVLLGTTNGSGNLSGTVPGAVFSVGQGFSIGDELFAVTTAGLQPLLDTGNTTVATYNTANGNFVFTGSAALTDVYFYPGLPVMGLITYEEGPSVSNQRLIGFDTQFAYERNATSWERLATEDAPGDSVWTGSDSQFFWADNYRGSNSSETWLFVTNFNENEPNFMRYFDGTTWFSFNPSFSATPGNTVITCRLIISFKDKLLLFNTVEDNSVLGNGLAFRNRMRYSVTGDPTIASAFYETPDPAGYGGFVDNLATQEAIVGAEFIKDRLIVFFEQSTWELVYTGNYIQPFRWQKINTELGVESTFSTIPFDKVVLGIGDVGIHACTGANVERIDDKIPDKVFEIRNFATGVERVYGIRDYYNELAYWTFPTAYFLDTVKYPNRILVYNYKTQSWAFNDDTITCFGYYYNQPGITWSSATLQWQEYIQTWESGSNSNGFRNVVAGNQQGFTFNIDADVSRNAEALSINNISVNGNLIQITCINHNMIADSDFVLIENCQGMGGINNMIALVVAVVDVNNFIVLIPSVVGTYTGGGTIARVSRVDIVTKQYNFYLNQGRNASVTRVDFFVDKTTEGQVTIDYYTSTANQIIGSQILETSPYALYPLESNQDQLWHPVYLLAEGEFIQLRIYMSDDQMIDNSIALSDFQLNAMTFYAQRTSDRLQ